VPAGTPTGGGHVSVYRIALGEGPLNWLNDRDPGDMETYGRLNGPTVCASGGRGACRAASVTAA